MYGQNFPLPSEKVLQPLVIIGMWTGPEYHQEKEEAPVPEREIAKAIKGASSYNIENSYDLAKYAASTLTEKNSGDLVSEEFIKKLNLPQLVILCLIMPMDLHKKFMVKLIGVCLESDRNELKPAIRNALAMKMIRISVMDRSVSALWSSNLIQKLAQSNLKAWQVPLLYLSAQAGQPLDIGVDPTFDVRLDTIAYLYSGINKIMAGFYDSADEDLLHAWTLSKGAKDVRGDIIRYMSLSAYLSGKSIEVFHSRMSRKYWPTKGMPYAIWNIYERLPDFGGSVYGLVAGPIYRMQTKRLIIDISKCVTSISVSDLQGMCQIKNISDIIATLVTEGEINATIENNVVTMSPCQLAGKIERELFDVSRLKA